MASPTKLVSTSVGFTDATGSTARTANGFLKLQLSQSVEVTATGGLVINAPISLPLDANAKITPTAIWFSDEVQPVGTTYRAILYGSNGCSMIQDFGFWSLTGPSADLSTMVPVSSGVSSAGAVLLTPSGSQTITTGNLTLTTGSFIETAAAVTGTGGLVRATSPTLVTPNIGVATGTSLALGGGTALTTTNRTGTGNLVLATSPTLVTPVLGVASGTSLALAGALTGATLTGASSGNSTNLLNQQAPTGTLTGTGAAQTVYTYTLPGNTVVTGKSLYLRTMFNHNSGTASVTYVLSLNATTLLTFASSTAGSHVIDIDILNTGAATGAVMELFGATSAPAGQTIGSGLAWASNQVLTLTFNVANTDQVTGQGWKLTLDQ